MSENLYMQLLNLDNSSDEPVGTREEILRAPFGYLGGKSRSVKTILEHLPYRNTYCEPFGGSAAVLLSRDPVPLEIYNDRYGGVVCFYRCIRDKPKELQERLELVVHSREEFLWCKETWEHCQDEVERAARWYYMIQASFGSLGRNWGRVSSGKGMMGNKILNNLCLFSQIHNRIKNVQIENLDWLLCFKDYDNPETVFYVDPPYIETNDKYVYKHRLSKEDHIKLCNVIFNCEGYVALSSYDNALYNSFDWDDIIDWEIATSMTSLAESKGKEKTVMKREKVTEKLYIKY